MHGKKKGQNIRAEASPPPFRAMSERKHFVLEGLPLAPLGALYVIMLLCEVAAAAQTFCIFTQPAMPRVPTVTEDHIINTTGSSSHNGNPRRSSSIT